MVLHSQALEGRALRPRRSQGLCQNQRQDTEQVVQAERAEPKDECGSPAVLGQRPGHVFYGSIGKSWWSIGEGKDELMETAPLGSLQNQELSWAQDAHASIWDPFEEKVRLTRVLRF